MIIGITGTRRGMSTMKALITVLLLLLPVQASGQEALPYKIAGNLLLLADWHQTRYIAGHPEQFYERNPILGKHPSKGKVDTYFVAALAIVNVADYVIDEKYRKNMWIGITLVEGTVVANNMAIGVKFNF